MFILPLTFSSFLIILTHSLFNAGLARLPTPEIYISAFAVAKSLMHIFQSPIMMTRQTVTALADDRQSYKRSRIFLSLVVISIVVVLGIISYTGISRWIFREIMGLTGQTLEASITMLKVLFIFPGMVGIRDFLAGVCIKFRIAPLISVASVMRVIYVSIFVSFIDNIVILPGAILAAIMFLGGIICEVLVLVFGTRLILKNIPKSLESIKIRLSESPINDLTYKSIIAFFSPLAISAYLRTMTMPIINSGLARTYRPEIAISVFAVALSLGMIFVSPLLMFHQVPLQFINNENDHNMRSVKKFAAILGITLSSVMIIVSFTKISYLILFHLIGTSHEISVLSVDVLKIMSILPILFVGREFYWGIMMKRRLTKFIGIGKTINLVFLVTIILIMTLFTISNPSIIGAVALIGSQFSEVIYLYIISKKKSKV